MAISELHKRWQSIDGKAKRNQIISTLKKRGKLSSLEYLQRIDGCWDLRGIELEMPRKGQDYSSNQFEAYSLTEMQEFKNVTVADIDFSECNLSRSEWVGCHFKNVSFVKSVLRKIKFWSCMFTNVHFDEADLQESNMEGAALLTANKYIGGTFRDADLRKSIHGVETYIDCDFSHANLTELRFDNTSFIRCKFSGILDSVSFSAEKTEFSLFPLLRLGRNTLYDAVDFSTAEFIGCDIYGIDLQNCKLPNDEKHLIIRHPYKVYNEAVEQFKNEWQGEDKYNGIDYIEKVLMTHLNPDLPIDIVNRDFLSSYQHKRGFGDCIYQVLKEVNVKVNGTIQTE